MYDQLGSVALPVTESTVPAGPPVIVISIIEQSDRNLYER